MTIKEKNYWLETVTKPPAQSARDLPDSIDVAVVGAGFCGLSAARMLAKRGVNVAVFESETFGWGASSRNTLPASRMRRSAPARVFTLTRALQPSSRKPTTARANFACKLQKAPPPRAN